MVGEAFRCFSLLAFFKFSVLFTLITTSTYYLHKPKKTESCFYCGRKRDAIVLNSETVRKAVPLTSAVEMSKREHRDPRHMTERVEGLSSVSNTKDQAIPISASQWDKCWSQTNLGLNPGFAIHSCVTSGCHHGMAIDVSAGEPCVSRGWGIKVLPAARLSPF